MNVETKYLKIEGKTLKATGRVGYIVAFTLLGLLFMTVIDFLLWSLLDNRTLLKFVFSGEQGFISWLKLMWSTYDYSWEKPVIFGAVFVFLSNYRSKKIMEVLD